MLQFPPIPDCKKYTEGSDLTLEALTMQKAFTKQKLSSDDDRILAECAEFYEHAFTYLKEVNLSTISENDNQLIKEYLQEVLRFQLIFQTGINFHRGYRVSIVRDSFLVDGRVKDNDGEHYTGCTADLRKRYQLHANGLVAATASRLPAELLFYCAFKEKYKAFDFEKYLKGGSGRAFMNKRLI